MRIAIVTDAWEPQVNGVVNTLRGTQHCLIDHGHQVLLLTPNDFRTFACPGYPEIRLACKPYRGVAYALDAFAPDCIHIATEGPMGLAARRYCLRRGLDFSSAYHTRFPEYLSARAMLPAALTYRWLKWFHRPSKAMMVPTPRIAAVLEQRGFKHVVLWSRGVDTELFRPSGRVHSGVERPIYLYVGRLAVEKNIEAFLDMRLPGTKWVIGDGPLRDALERRYPDARFLGAKSNDALPSYYNSADVFVFPSRTDTFGLVMLEAMACGIPVAAYPVEGPLDVVANGVSGVLHQDLAQACVNALHLRRRDARKHALNFSWESATQQFLQHLHPVRAMAASQTPHLLSLWQSI